MLYTNQGLIFESAAYPNEETKFLVTKVDGQETMSSLFEFEIEMLVELPDEQSAEVDLDLAAMVRNAATLRILANQGTQSEPDDWHEISGVLRLFEQQEEVSSGWGRFRAVLMPKAWQATRTRRSRVFQDLSIEDLIAEVRDSAPLPLLAADVDIQLSRTPNASASTSRAIYPTHAYLVQYEETDWHFLSRRLEHEGIYYYFKNVAGTEKVVFGDATSNYNQTATPLPYRPNGNGAGNGEAEEIRSFHCCQRPAPEKVIVREYNWLTPASTLEHEEEVDAQGGGEQVLFNERFLNADQAEEIATMRQESLAARVETYRGSSNARSLRPGNTITLSDHYRDEFNSPGYVITQVTHTAVQNITLDGANVAISGCNYTNTFKSVKDSVVWRPSCKTPTPRIHGLMTGKVESDSADLRYAVLDEHGRYLVTMRYDSTATPVKRWMRMSQPSAGPASGFHFPVNPGSEVVIAHIDGDPDRPIIVGAVPNPENESPSTEDNVSENAIQTRSGNMLRLDDDEGASGFVRMDASRSKVSDQRRRGILDPLDSFTNWAQNQTGGGGNASPDAADETSQPPEPAAADREIAGAAPRSERSPAPSSGAGNAGAIAGPPNLKKAWDAFFDGDAMRELSQVGPYRPQGGATLDPNNRWGGMQVSDPSDIDLPDGTKLNEANIVKLLNHVARDHTDSINSLSNSGDLKGKTRDLILNKAQNFEGSAAGSTVSVDIGDNFIYSLGDKFEYADGSNSVSIGTGGYTREETRGAGTTEVFTWGEQKTTTVHQGTQTEKTTWHGQRHTNETINDPSLAHTDHYSTDTSFTYRGGWTATCAISVSGQTNTEIFVGGYNANTVSLAVFVDIGINVAGKFELDVTVESGKVTLGMSQEFELDRKHGCLNQNEVFLNNMEAALKVSEARLKKTEAALAEEQAALVKRDAAVKKQLAAVKNDEFLANVTKMVLQRNLASLNDQKAALIKKDAALQASKSALASMQTAAFHSVQ